jgi:peptidoglycan hydrolase-like protein with peptidoglycan-binding domain
MRTLKLTSPMMRGDDVKRLQQGLIKRGYLKDQADSVYGNLTAQAVYRAKFWLGYRVPDQAASGLLLSYLEGKETTPEMKKRAAERKKAQSQIPMRQKALNYLNTKIGVKENPAGSNRVPFASEWYGLIGPWCAMAVTRAYVEAGSKGFAKGSRWAYVPYIVADAQHARNGLTLTRDPQPGDIVCFDWDGGVADHVGLFRRWLNRAQGTFESVEGNTSVGNDSNGGEVMVRQRKTSQVEAFVHCAR